MKTSDILSLIKEIAYHATSVDMRVNADLILQEVTAVAPITLDAPMAVMARKGRPGIILGFNPLHLKGLSPAQVKTIMVHETQHLLAGDLMAGQDFKENPKDWYNGWDGALLHNYARDCQINDLLYSLGYARVPKGVDGPSMLGRDTRQDAVETLMREIAAKYPPPPAGSAGDATGDAEAQLARADAPGTDSGNKIEVTKEWGTAKSDKPAQVLVSDEQARWERFMAETLDSSKVKETWRNIPKRYAGVDMFAGREAVLPRRTPQPRKSALIAIDVSGSMDESGVDRLCNLVRNSGATYDLEVILFNTETKTWADFRTNTVMPMRGGGTNFTPVEEYCLRKARYPDAVLVLTDGQAELVAPKRPSVWTWVLYQANVDAFRDQFKMRSVGLDAIIKRGRR